MIRITGGRYRGRQIHCPSGKAVRPTTSFVRESLFSILGTKLMEARFLDAFAGCGIVGFEALGRGAAHVTAVEKASISCRAIRQNRDTLGIAAESHQIVQNDLGTWLSRWAGSGEAPYDIMYWDPPYTLENLTEMLGMVAEVGCLAPGGKFIVEWGSPDLKLPDGLSLAEGRKYGTTMLHFLELD